MSRAKEHPYGFNNNDPLIFLDVIGEATTPITIGQCRAILQAELLYIDLLFIIEMIQVEIDDLRREQKNVDINSACETIAWNKYLRCIGSSWSPMCEIDYISDMEQCGIWFNQAEERRKEQLANDIADVDKRRSERRSRAFNRYFDCVAMAQATLSPGKII